MKTAVITFIAVLCISACSNTTNTKADSSNKAGISAVAVYVFPVQHGGYGYSIVVNNKEFIKQDCIPAIQGNKPFVSKEQAKKTGELVAGKIRSGELPTLTLDDLNKLGIAQ